jgi:hypothetical protein
VRFALHLACGMRARYLAASAREYGAHLTENWRKYKPSKPLRLLTPTCCFSHGGGLRSRHCRMAESTSTRPLLLPSTRAAANFLAEGRTSARISSERATRKALPQIFTRWIRGSRSAAISSSLPSSDAARPIPTPWPAPTDAPHMRARPSDNPTTASTCRDIDPGSGRMKSEDAS